MKKYRKRPSTVIAVQWFPGVALPFGKECGILLPESERVYRFYNHLHELELEAKPGDWIIDQGGGDRYPCKPDVFTQTYDEVIE